MRNAFCRVIVDSWLQYPKGSKGLEGWAPWVSKAARNVYLVIKLILQASKHDSSDGWACELFLWPTLWWQGTKLEKAEASGTHDSVTLHATWDWISTYWNRVVKVWQVSHSAPYNPQHPLQRNDQPCHCWHLEMNALFCGVEMPLFVEWWTILHLPVIIQYTLLLCVCGHAYVWRPEMNTVFLNHLPPCFLRQGLSLWTQSSLIHLVSQ